MSYFIISLQAVILYQLRCINIQILIQILTKYDRHTTIIKQSAFCCQIQSQEES